MRLYLYGGIAAIGERFQFLGAQVEKKNFVKRVENYIDKITAYMDRQMLEDTILDWSKNPGRKPYLDILKRKRKTIKQ